jgi:hypothetical protein
MNKPDTKYKTLFSAIFAVIILICAFSSASFVSPLFAQENLINARIDTDVGSIELTSETKDFSANQDPVFAVNKTYDSGFTGIGQRFSGFVNYARDIFGEKDMHEVKVEFTDNSGAKVQDNLIFYEQAPDEVMVSKDKLEPGVYTLTASDGNGNSIQQDFTWGVLAINTNKSIYAPGETAKLAMAVLDERGEMVCNAKLQLEVGNNDSTIADLTTDEGDIIVNDACRTKEFTLEPDYEASFNVEGVGTYKMTLTAQTDNGQYTIVDTFEVREGVDFEVERITATRLYPKNDYPVIIEVEPNKDFRGEIIEPVYSSLQVFYTDNRELLDKFDLDYDVESGVEKTHIAKFEGNYKLLKWSVDWKAGNTYHLAYWYDPPEKSPDFFLLGPLKIGEYQESRQWMLANDATLTPLQGAANWEADDTNYVDFTDPQSGGSPQTLSRALDDVDADFETMLTLSWEVTYFLSGVGGDDTYQLLIRIVNGATILAAADSGGTFQEVAADVNSDTDVTTGPTAFTYVNTTADKTTWNGASIELQQVHTKSGGWDNHFIRTDFTEMTGTYTTASDSWTGIAYSDEGFIPDTSATICGRVNNTTEGCDATDASGEFIVNTVDATAADQLTFFFDAGTGLGNTVTISDGGDIVSGDNLKVYENTVMVRHEQGASIAISNMANYDRDNNSTDIVYTANTTLSLESGHKFHVYSDGTNNFTFDPGNTVTTSGTEGDFIAANSSVAYFDTSTNSISGDLVASSSATINFDASVNITKTSANITCTGTCQASAGTQTISGGATISGGGTINFYDLSTSTSGTTTLSSSASVDNNATVGSGTAFNVNADLSVAGNFQNTTTGIINTTSGTPTVTLTGSATLGGGSGNITLHHLTTSGTGTSSFSGTGTNTINGNITVGSGTTLNVNDDISVAGNFQNTTTGVIGTSAGTPTVTFTGSATIGGGSGAITFHHLTTSGSGTHTFSGSGTNTFNGNITVGSGTTLNVNDDISVAGNFQNTTTGVIGTSAGTPTVTFTGSATIGGGSGAITFHHLSTSGTGTSSFSGSGTNTINGNVTAGSGTTLNINSNVSIAGNLVNTTTGIIGYSGTPTITMTGTSNSLAGGSGTVDFYNLTIDPSSAGTITLNSNATVDNTLDVATSDELSIAASQTITQNGSITLNGTISGSGRLDYTASGDFPTSGTYSADLRIDGTNGNRNVVDRTNGYGGSLEIYSNSATDRSFTIGTGASQSIDVTGNLTLNANSTGSVTLSGATHDPTVNITGNLDSTTGGGTENITTGTGNWTVSGNVDFTDVGTFTATSGNTFRMDGASKNLTSSGESFDNFSATGGSISTTDSMAVSNNFATSGATSFTHGSGNMDVDGTFTVGDGTTFVHGAGADIDIFIAGNFTLEDTGSGSTWTENTTSTSQVTFDGDLEYTDDNSPLQSIGNVVIGASPATTNLTSDYSSNSVTVIAGDFFNTCGYDMDIGNGGITLNTGSPGGTLDTSDSGSGTNPCSGGVSGDETIINDGNLFDIQSGAVFVQDQSTVIFDDNDGTNAVTSNGESFYNFTIDDSNDDASLIIQIEDDLDVDNNLTITDGQLDANSGPSYQINVGGNWDNDSKFEAGTGTVVFDAQSTGKTIDALGGTPDEFYIVQFDDGVGTASWQLTTALDADNNFTITDGTVDANGQTINIGNNYSNSGTFTANSGTVIMDAQDAGNTLSGTMTGSSSFYALEFDDSVSSGAWSFGSNNATVTNNFTITGGTVTAPGSGYTLTIGANFTNGDGFTHNSGEVVFNTSANSTLSYSGNTTFYDLTMSTANKQFYFDDTYDTIIDASGTWTVQGTSCASNEKVYLDSETDGNQWDIDVNATATTNIDYADIEDSNAINAITAENSTEVNEGNTNWTINEGTCGSHQVNIQGDTRIKGDVRIK